MRFLLENPTLYVSFKPFLQALQAADASPLRSKLLDSMTPKGAGSTYSPRLPEYSRLTTFHWDVSHLLRTGSPYASFRIRPSLESSVRGSLPQFRQWSILDPSQASAVISALTQEHCLIQGPPGTGKTFTGVQLLRTFVLNNVGPIIVMAQTNHALDNILRAAYDSGFTKEIVRLGVGSDDSVLKRLTLRKREQKIKKKISKHEDGKRLTQLLKVTQKMDKVCLYLTMRTMR